MISNDKEKEIKTSRIMELFFRAIKGEALSVRKLADEYNVSPRSITRDINDLKAFLSDHSDILGYAELIYSSSSHCYTLNMDSFLTNKELVAISKILIGSRAFNTQELLEIIKKLKTNTTPSDRSRLESLIGKELYTYDEINFDCESIIDNLWKITECIENKSVITIRYHKMDRSVVNRRIMPISILFSEYYYYLIAYNCESEKSDTPVYFRIDRIIGITIHREKYTLTQEQSIDEGLLRRKSHFMWPGPNRKIRFEFSGPSVQAILDRIPTAKIVDRHENIYTLEAEVFGTGIKMYLLSQGAWVKVIGPDEFVQEMKSEIHNMLSLYN